MKSELWRWADPDGQQRRVRLDELRAALADGSIAPNAPVWRPGFANWIAAHDVPELTTSALSAANGVVPNIPPPPLAVVAVQHQFEAQAGVAEAGSSEEPPPPPRYVPAPVKPSLIPIAPSSASSVSSRVPPAPPSSSGRLPPTGQSSGQMPSSLPTAIGLPPPPDLLAAVAQAKEAKEAKAAAEAASRPTPSKPPPPVSKRPPPPQGMVEELSGSAILPESDPRFAESAPDAPLGLDGLPAPTDPIVHGGDADLRSSSGSIPGVPRAGGLSVILDDIKLLRAGQKPKNKLIFPVLGLLGFSVLIMLIAGVVSLFSGGSSDSSKQAKDAKDKDTKAGTASSLTSATPSAAPKASATAASDTKPETSAAPATAKAGEALGPCTLVGEDKVLAPRALVSAGVEAVALDGKLVVGFAPTPGNGNALALDPSSLAVSSTVKGRGPSGEVKRVTPALVNAKLVALVDGERKGDKIASRRAVATGIPIDLGVAEGAIVWASHNKDGWAKVVGLDDGAGPVEALRAVPLSSSQKGVAFVYRRDGAIFFGAATGEGKLDMAGTVAKVPGLGGQVGSPALATSDDQLVVAWADRAEATGPWKVRWTRMPVGGAASEATTFELPAGGLGEQAMSPAVAGLGKGRFVLAWTEGPVSKHQVRALTIDETGKPMGEPLTISPASVNAGQPQVAVGPDGRGLVAFLGAKGKGYELRAASIRCGK